MAFSLPLCLEGQHPGVTSSLWTLGLAFCGYHLMKLPVEDSNVLVLLLSCALGPPTSHSILVRARLCCSLKGVVHTVVGNLQFLGNCSHGIAFISQNKNRLSSLRRKFSFSGHFESIIEPTNARLYRPGLGRVVNDLFQAEKSKARESDQTQTKGKRIVKRNLEWSDIKY